MFEKTHSLIVRSDRGRKPVLEEVVTNVATAMIDMSQRTLFGSSSGVLGVARELDLNVSMVWKAPNSPLLSIQDNLIETTLTYPF